MIKKKRRLVQKIQQITILKNGEHWYIFAAFVQKIQQITILKNPLIVHQLQLAFKKYNKLQSLRTFVNLFRSLWCSKNTTNYNP